MSDSESELVCSHVNNTLTPLNSMSDSESELISLAHINNTLTPLTLNTINPLTAIMWGSGYKLFVKWLHYPGARQECYLQNGAVIQRPG